MRGKVYNQEKIHDYFNYFSLIYTLHPKPPASPFPSVSIPHPQPKHADVILECSLCWVNLCSGSWPYKHTPSQIIYFLIWKIFRFKIKLTPLTPLLSGVSSRLLLTNLMWDQLRNVFLLAFTITNRKHKHCWFPTFSYFSDWWCPGEFL